MDKRLAHRAGRGTAIHESSFWFDSITILPGWYSRSTFANFRKHFILKETVEEIKESLYVDDLISGGYTKEEVLQLKTTAINLMKDGGFELHKWHSNIPELESGKLEIDQNKTYAKLQFGVKQNESKILGIPWNKTDDKIAVVMQDRETENTKRGVLQQLASIYDPLGLLSPILLSGKIIYRAVCDEKLSWDQPLSDTLRNMWKKYMGQLPEKVEVPRTLCLHRESIDYIDLHAFGDASKEGTAAVLYAVINQPSGTNQGLVAARARLSKKDTTIPRLELVAAHMATNLLENAKNVLRRFPVRSIHGWTDSTVALHWIRAQGNYKQYVSNRVKKIREKEFIEWSNVPGEQNPANVGSRGCRQKI